MLYLYSIFHLNMAYSSIEEEQRSEVIQRCYWPLLHLADRHGFPFAVEASGYTLKSIAQLDRPWVDKLSSLIKRGTCQLLGSGYAQIIGPLVPGDVNRENLNHGNKVYQELLGVSPEIALVNEQAYSAGMVGHYLKAGYKAVVMEWNNPHRTHPGWNRAWRYRPHVVKGSSGEGEEIQVIWNDAISFQKFQRYVHSEMELLEYLDFLDSHRADTPRAFPLYGNDAEVFDFRPGRYATEAPNNGQEWARIERLLGALQLDEKVKMVLPGELLRLGPKLGDPMLLSLESSVQPIPVKKQGKYNIIRWAVSGRDDLKINTACFRIYDALKRSSNTNPESWRELCYLWSSDFRTHMTARRWEKYLQRLQGFQDQMEAQVQGGGTFEHSPLYGVWEKSPLPATPVPLEKFSQFKPDIQRQRNLLIIETDSIRISLNCRRGLAVDQLIFKGICQAPMVGTLSHGYYHDILYGADYYTGHVVLESPGQMKITDLNPVEPQVEIGDGHVSVQGRIMTPSGPVRKFIRIHGESDRVDVEYRFEWKRMPLGSLRLGHITMLPEAFDKDTLFYRTSNGGDTPELYDVQEKIDHGAAYSFLISASHALGITDGVMDMGDARRFVRVEIDKTTAALVGLICFAPVDETFFYRLLLSASEMDDTSMHSFGQEKNFCRSFRFSVSGYRTCT